MSYKKIVVAPQSFKGSLSAHLVALAMQEGIHQVLPNCQVVVSPVADGGEEFLFIMMEQKQDSFNYESVTGIFGESIQVPWGMLPNSQTAVIEVSKVLGLGLVPKDKLNPLLASSYGLGQLILKLLDKGVKKFLIGLGGSATNDAGAGMIQALGVQLLDAQGKDLKRGGAALNSLHTIDIRSIDPRLGKCEFLIGCDVLNPLLGPDGATHAYSEQKGATPEMIIELEKGLTQFAHVVKNQLGKDIRYLPKGGASGGLGAAFLAFFNSKLVLGIDLVLDFLQFDRLIQDADLIITGEGCLDFQTAFNKGPYGVALRAKKQKIPIEAVVGILGKNYQRALEATGIRVALPLGSKDFSKTYENIIQATKKLIIKRNDV